MRPEPAKRRRRRRGPLVVALAAIVILVLGALVVNSAGSRGGTAPRIVPSVPLGRDLSPTVLTYFFYWYDLPRGVHSAELTDHPIDPNASCRNVGWFKQQFMDMEDAGIDVALADYWGRQEPCSDVGLVNMAKAAEQLRQAGRHPPHIGMVLDTGLIAAWPLPERDLTKPANQERVYQLIHTFYSLLPVTDWARVDGRPIVWLWAAYFDITFDHSFFDDVSNRFAADFKARPYVVGESSFRYAITWTPSGRQMDTSKPMPLDDFYEWGAAIRGYTNDGGNIAEVGPGYDERTLTGPGRSGRYQDREDGRFYERNLAAAIASGKPFLVIETWDEFHEATDVADSTEYGRQYIDITRQYVDQLKASHHAQGT